MTFTKFDSFTEALAEGVHNFASDTIKVGLTNTAPAASNTVWTDITEIAAGNGYTAGGNAATLNTSAQTSGVYKYVHNTVNFIASGGTIGPFRWIVFYNDTAAGDELIGYIDYGSAYTIADGETFPINTNSNGLFTLG